MKIDCCKCGQDGEAVCCGKRFVFCATKGREFNVENVRAAPPGTHPHFRQYAVKCPQCGATQDHYNEGS